MEYLGGAMYKEYFNELKRCIDLLDVNEIERIEKLIVNTIKNRGNIYIIGNGGSSSTASHYVVDFTKKLDFNELPRVNIYNLSDNISTVTAYANDISYEDIYFEQLKNKIVNSDMLIVLSASGKSKNLLKAAKYAKERKASVVSIVGNFEGEVLKFSDYKLIIDSKDYGIIEDIHLSLNHVISSNIKEVYNHG
ncbi:MAG TPA: SIS domain-containing protein [Clostridiaceae bacterium]|jgi:D-sedoheptulose 7-phosphate isomerase|nr:hypothetical protein [Clostridiales bacterium]HJJ09925.1 SIS domain-containing protein [Clostridiaceae bacterium]